MTNPFRRGAPASPRGSAKLRDPWVLIERAEVTEKAMFGARHVVGVGMLGRQGGVSGETCRLCAKPAGVRARIIPQRREPREVRLAKPGRGKVGRKVDA